MNNEPRTTDNGQRQTVNGLGEFLRQLRSVRRLTLKDVERASDISDAYLSDLEKSKIARPAPHYLQRLASVYDVAYETLLERAGYLAGASFLSAPAAASRLAQEQPTPLEEEELLRYLAFLRFSRR